MKTEYDDVSLAQLKEGLRDVEESIGAVMFQFEELYGMPITEILIHRDPETREVLAVKCPIFEPTMYADE